ncbi:hypothetical protein AB7C87_03590 [Natrarchaeobius sp. A-rgal3]|uniref:hypothetical protein n=1 Tax=Natrarchaeobius versutus TaxID=1679078 RepID=UPI0035107B2E
MELGLDIGRGTIRVAVGDSDSDGIESVRPIVYPTDAATLEEASVSPSAVQTVERGETTYVVSSDAEAVARAVDDEVVSTFSEDGEGIGDHRDDLLEALVRSALDEKSTEHLCYTVPGPTRDGGRPLETYRDVVESALPPGDLEPTPIDRGFAVVYDQLAADNYTGLGIYVGREATSVTLSYYGVPTMSVSVDYGADSVIEEASAETGTDEGRVREVLTAFVLDPEEATSDVESAIARAYDELIGVMAETIAERADERDHQGAVSVPVAIAGEGAVEGLEYLVGGRFDAAALPVSVRGVRLADDPAASAARGALSAARDGLRGDDGIVRAVGDTSGAGDGGSGGNDSTSAGTKSVASLADDPESVESLAFDEFSLEDEPADRSEGAIDELFSRLANRDDEVESVRVDLESTVETLAELEAESASADAVADLRDRLEVVDDRLSTLDRSLESVTVDLSTVEEQATDERASLSDSISELEDDVSAVAESTAVVRDDLDALEDDFERVETRGDETAGRLEDQSVRIDGVSGRLEELTEQVAAIESALRDDLESVTARVAGLEDDRARDDDRLEAIEEDVTAWDDRLEDVDAELRTVDDRFDDVDNRLTDHGDRLETDGDRLDTHDDRFENVRAELESHGERFEELDEEVTAHDIRFGTLEDRVGAHDDRLEAIEEVTDDDRAGNALEDGLSALEERTTALSDGLETAEEGLEAADERLAAVESELGRIDGHDERLDAVETATDDADSRLDELVDEIDDSRANADRLERIEDRLGDRDDRLEWIESDVDELGDSLESVPERSTVATLEEDVRSLVDETGSLETRLSAVDDDVSAVETRLTDLESNERSEGRSNEDLTDVRAQLERTQSELEETRAELEETQSGLEMMSSGSEGTRDESGSTAIGTLAGGGGAGIVTGFALALGSDLAVGLLVVLVGIALSVAAIAVDRSVL